MVIPIPLISAANKNMIDDSQRENIFGMLMSLNMLIEFGGAFDYTGWTSETGAKRQVLIILKLLVLRA